MFEIEFEKSSDYERNSRSGLALDVIKQMDIHGRSLNAMKQELCETFRTNFAPGYRYPEHDIHIWHTVQENITHMQITPHKSFNLEKGQKIVERIAEIGRRHEVRYFVVMQGKVVSDELVLEFLQNLQIRSIQDVIRNLPSLSVIPEKLQQDSDTVREAVNRINMYLYRALADKKVRINGTIGYIEGITDDVGFANIYFIHDTGVKTLSVSPEYEGRGINTLEVIGKPKVKELPEPLALVG